mgnify:CR=1 FL=1
MIRPVLVAIGEICDRPVDLTQGLDPIGLMAAAARRAEEDLGQPVLARVDALEVVHQISWRYEDTARRLCERLGVSPPRAVYHPGGGDSPLHILHEAALRIARGESRIALICGGEAQNTAKKARAEGLELPWPRRARLMEHPWDVEHKIGAMGRAHGLAQPTYIYPLYENATLHAWGQTPSQAQAESAELWARYAQVAATNPFAWQRKPKSADEIATVAPSNPLIAWPYPRLMVANPTVNQGAAVIVMAEALADELAIPHARRVHLAGGAAAREPDDYLHRNGYTSCPAQQVVLDAARAFAPETGFDALELYSCFPCVPKMARRQLGLGTDVEPTVTGGLTFFGGPFNDYMLHAACAMIRRLRGTSQTGLLYGQGDFVTKHHALIFSGAPCAAPLDQDYRLDDAADAVRGTLPSVVEQAQGLGQLETFTILPDRQGGFARGVAVLRTAEGARTMARVVPDDRVTLAMLSDPLRSPIGSRGPMTTAADGLLEWTLA